MRKELAQELDNILNSGNFKSMVVSDILHKDKTYKFGLKIIHDEVSTELALQHIQEHINEDLDNNCDWVDEFDLDDVNNINEDLDNNCDWVDEFDLDDVNKLKLVEQNEKYSIFV